MNFQSRAAANLAALAVLSSLTPAQADAPAAAAPLRHLVYSFTWGTSTDTETHVSGMRDNANGSGAPGDPGVASGVADQTGGANDKGTIAVDVLREQPDKGLVVSISEQARDARTALPATCVVFGNTTIVCDPNGKINQEELTLLRFLGADFVDPNKLDAKRHWQVSQDDGGYSTTADYTISANASGVMKIDETRIVKESKTKTNTIDTQISYDFNHQVPTGITEYSIEHLESGEQYTTFKTETVLNLLSDSMAGKS